ncbi:hypothetical protein ACI6PS_03635 [Flavobacterium sp. PLA-1-15]|uniref:hypothetical protein n=1 Tax=Flavobacterium sp. PLA-1-15 TaxID=3380533 RepID=UPI003B77797E
MKKLLIVGALGVAAFMFFGQKKDYEAQQSSSTDFRELSDAEAQNYLNQNPDLKDYAEKNNASDILGYAKWHWRVQGWENEFSKGTRQNPYLS